MEYPNMIFSLPEADIPYKGVKGWILQSQARQLVFMEIEPMGEVAEHSHAAQFSVVVDGEMSLTIGGKTQRYRKGDTFYIPAHTPHSAVFHSKTRVIDLFDEPSRYKSKK